MKNDRKPNANAVLKNLPEPRQAEIYARCNLPAKEGGGFANVRAWLAEDGIRTSEAALSYFFSWYGLRQQVARNEQTVETLLEKFREADPDATPEKVQSIGQAFFSAMALDQQDPKVWYLTQQLGLKREQLNLDRDKFEFDAAKACLAKLPELKAVSDKPKLNEEEKAKAIQQILFPK